MLTAYNLQVNTKLVKETEVSPKICSRENVEPISPFSFIADTTVAPKLEQVNKITIEQRKTNKEIFDISCHEIRNFLFGISGMISLLSKNSTAYTELLQSPMGKTINENLRIEILKIVVFIKNQINELNTLAAKQREIVNGVLNSPKSHYSNSISMIGIMNAKNPEEKAVQILTAKLGINNTVNELKKANDKLETLLTSSLGQELETSVKKELTSLIEADKRSIYILDICVEDQEDVIDGLGVARTGGVIHSPRKQDNFLMQPKKIIAEIADILKEKLEEKKLTLELNLPDNDILIEANPVNLRRILINLVSNAIKFTANREGNPGIIKINFAKPKINSNESTLTFCVEDNGIGIKKSEQEDIFKPYQQANAQIVKTYGGTGLGLSCIKKLVKSMQGEINCESMENVGSKFTFSIKCPVLAKLPTSSASPLIFSTPVPANKAKHLLIADDQLINRKLLQTFLSKAGYTFDVAKNGKEAVELCENIKFDGILMDINMPEMNGLEATRTIRTSPIIKAAGNQTAPVIALTGHETQDDIQKALEAGMDDYVVKGYEFNQSLILEKIETLCSKNKNVSTGSKLK